MCRNKSKSTFRITAQAVLRILKRILLPQSARHEEPILKVIGTQVETKQRSKDVINHVIFKANGRTSSVTLGL